MFQNEEEFIMKKFSNKAFIPFLIFPIVAWFSAIGSATELKLSPEQKEVWSEIERFWELIENGELEKILDSLHPKYVYWQKEYTVIFNKSDTEFTLTKGLTHNRPKSYELKPMQIQLIGNVALIFYSYEFEGNMHSDKGRRMVVMMKTDGKWKTVGGMSAPLEISVSD
jgi:hypothetical protein